MKTTSALTPETFAETKAEFLKSKRMIGASKATLSSYEEWLSRYPFQEITHQTVEKYVRMLLDMKITNTSRISYLGVVRNFAGWCVQRGYLPSNPVIKPQWKKERPERPAITEEEYHKLLAATKKAKLWCRHPDAERIWTYALTLGWHTGLRTGDVCTLKWESVDSQARVLTIKPRKTLRLGKKISIPYGNEVAAVLEAHAGLDPEFVCPELEQVYRLNVGSFKDYFAEMTAYAGVKKSFHCFRHAFITRLLSKNYSAELVAGVTGQSLQQVLGYFQLSVETKRQMLGIAEPEKAA